MLEALEDRLRDARERMIYLEKVRLDLERVASQVASTRSRIQRYARELSAASEEDAEEKRGFVRVLMDLVGLEGDGGEPDALARLRLHLEAEEGALAALDRARGPLHDRLRELGDPEGDLEKALEEKARLVAGAGGERAAALLAIAAEEGRLAAVVKEFEEARHAGRLAARELGSVERALRSAAEPLPLDVIGGGVVSAAMRRPALERVWKHVGLAEEAMRRFHAEVGDLASEGVPGLKSGVGGVEFTHGLLAAAVEDLRTGAGLRRCLERVRAAHRTVEGTLSLLESRAENLAEIRAGLRRRRKELLG